AGRRADRASRSYGDEAIRESVDPGSERPFGYGTRWPESGSVLDAPNSPILPPDFDPLAPNSEPFAGPTHPDHSPALQSAFRAPPVTVIPDDWDADPPVGARPQSQPQASRPLPRQIPQDDAISADLKQGRVPSTDATH